MLSASEMGETEKRENRRRLGKMGETITLIFSDGSHFDWHWGNPFHLRQVYKLQKSKGVPIEVIGEGEIAKTLRAKIEAYNTDPKNYKSTVIETASDFTGLSPEQVKARVEEVKKKLGRFGRGF
jgi:hypothetical protein